MLDPIGLPSRPNGERTSGARLRSLVVLALLLLAFGLRLYHLDFQSLEGDEGISLQRSSQPLGQMMELMPVEHVPGYFLLLFGWLRVAGAEDFALRYLSVVPSVMAVAVIYRWAAAMGRPTTGLIAALLLATNSFQIWYAQQARMYGWLLLTSLLSSWALWRLAEEEKGKGGWRWGVDLLYILSTAATVYLHYFGFLVPLAQTIFMTIRQLTGVLSGDFRDEWRARWPVTRRWLIDGTIIFLLFSPWLPRTMAFLGFQGWREPLDPWQVPWAMHSAYSVGFPMPDPWRSWLPWLYLLLALLGLVVWWRQKRSAWLLLATAAFVPFLLIMIAVLRNPDFHERYTLFLAAPWTVLIAGGFGIFSPLEGNASNRQRADHASGGLGAYMPAYLPLLLAIPFVALNSLAIQRLYFDTTIHKADYRGAAQRIRAVEAPGDVVLVDGPNPELVFNHYYQNPAGQESAAAEAPVYDLRSLAGKEYSEVSEALQADTGGAGRAWEVLYFHSPGPVQYWLATHGWSSAPTDHNGIRVSLYGLEGGPAMTEQELAIPFGPGLTLQKAAVDGPTLSAGDLLRVTTRWQVDAPLPDYKFSLRLLNPAGEYLLADDYMPQNWFAPTSQWPLGEAVDQRALLLPANLPPGSYVVTLRLYDPANGVAVETPEGQDVPLGTVEIH